MADSVSAVADWLLSVYAVWPVSWPDDLCIGFWQAMWKKGHIPLKFGAKVLEIGCAEADWLTPMKEERPDLYLVGLDWRDCERPGANEFLKGDVLTQEFEPESFDAIVMISALEHIGLGAYDNDPKDVDGDTHTLERCLRWLKPGGLVYFDVPYTPDGAYEVIGGRFRRYNRETLVSRLSPKGYVERRSCPMESAHPDGPYLAVVLQKA